MADQSAEIARAIQALSELSWRLQGRINALELICIQTIEDISRGHDDPKSYMRGFVERARDRALPLADVDDPTKGDRTIKERNEALEEFLIEVLDKAGSLKLDRS